MNLEQIKKIRDDVGKGKPLTIVYDNDKVIYDNVQDQFPVIWDDNKELLYQIGVDNYFHNQKKTPYIILAYTYECIQEIIIGSTVVDCIDFLKQEGGSLTTEQKKKCEDLMAKIGVANIPNPIQ